MNLTLCQNSEEMDAYKDFMEAGNTILLFKENPKGMFDLKTALGGMEFSIDESPNVHNQNETAYLAEIKSLVRLQTKQEDEILLYDEAGATCP